MSLPDHINSDIVGQIVPREGRLVLLFSRNVEGELRRAEIDNMTLDPQAALQMAELLTAMAFEADTSLKPVGPALKASLVEQHRKVLTPRLALMLNTLREKKAVTNKALAKDLIDTVFSEVFS